MRSCEPLWGGGLAGWRWSRVGQLPTSLDGSASVLHFFGAELRRLREGRRLSQDQLGRLVCFSGDMIRRVETGERFPRRELACACDKELATGGILERIWRVLDRGRCIDVRTRAGSRARSGLAGGDGGPGDGSVGGCVGSVRLSFLPGALDRAPV